MEWRCLGSGSDGNCYLLDNGKECLILDAGVSIKLVKQALNFDIGRIAGVCVTHEHKDHSLAVRDYQKLGIPVFQPYCGGETKMQYGGFRIWAFPLPHDGVMCCGFLIKHKDMGKLLYMTDMEYCPLTFKKQRVEHLLIEANYANEFLGADSAKREHVLRGHCELKTALGIIEHSKTDALQTVIFCHLSRDNADSEYFVEEGQKVAGKGIKVGAARKDTVALLFPDGYLPFAEVV